MDPDANLKEQLALAESIIEQADSDDSDGDMPQIDTHDAVRLAELVLAINEWISRGGFLPQQWRK